MANRKTVSERLAALKTRRDKLRAALAAVDSKIAAIEKAEEDRRTRELLALIKQRGITIEQLRALSAAQSDEQDAA